ncbi:MAG: SpoIIE family protein phosphatase, partial [Bacteroidetes bacterium]|nr:SpoIIE family protein phosphatase [Bacteroidota bacterium]
RKESFALHTLELKKGETLYLYTDGYADQFGGEKGKKFKYKQLNELLLQVNQLPMNEQEQKLSTTFNNWKGNLEQVDDVCVIGLRI